MRPPISTALGRKDALATAQRLALHIAGALTHVGYAGPVAVAGGYVRDIALARVPKDLDVFLDYSYYREVPGWDHAAGDGWNKRLAAMKFGEHLAGHLTGSRCTGSVLNYDNWAEGIEVVVKMQVTPQPGQELAWLDQCPIPDDIDLVFLGADVLPPPRLVNDYSNQIGFLRSVIDRVDIRMNAIGATPEAIYSNPEWDFDAYHNRLVVQKSRHDMPRISRRLKRLKSQKFPQWTIHYEHDDGSLSDNPPEPPPPADSVV